MLETIEFMRSHGARSERDFHSYSALLRGIAIELSCLKKTPHLGSVLSCADALAVSACFARNSADAPVEIVLSKGHAALGLYASLFIDGIIEEGLLLTYAEAGSILEEHPSHKIPGVQFPTGSLGHGLGLMAGRLLGAKLLGKTMSGIVLMSDGECNEGTVWEAVLFAASRKIRGLVAIVDANGFQATGPTSETYGSVALADIFRGFGWEGVDVDGHNHSALEQAISDGFKHDGPFFVIAHTTKGKGVSFMEADNNWHYRIPTEDEVGASLSELGIKASQ